MSKTALLFAGQGSQKAGMGKDLAEQFPLAKTLFEKANHTLGYDLSGICFHGPDSELTKTENAQPGIYLVSWVAFELLKSRLPDFTFAATAGLSLGEFTALAAADVMSFADGLQTVRERGRFMQEACESTHGAMAAIIALDETVARGICREADVELANLNCPGQLVISGEAEKVAKACELARLKGAKKAMTIQVAGAYHSRLMASARPKLRRALAGLALLPPRVMVISNVTAEPHGSPAEIVEGLVEQVTSSVRWEESIRYLLARGFARFIEFGPGTTLSGFLKRIDDTVVRLNVADAASLESTVKALGG